MHCSDCGMFWNTASDLCKAAQVIRMEEIARDIGVEITRWCRMIAFRALRFDITSGQDPRASRSGINILKNNAKSHVNKAGKLNVTISQLVVCVQLRCSACRHFAFNFWRSWLIRPQG